MVWNIINIKILKYNIIFFSLGSILLLLTFHNINIYAGFIIDIYEGWGGYEMKIDQNITQSNITKYMLKYYNFLHVYDLAFYYLIIVFGMLFVSFCTYIIFPFFLVCLNRTISKRSLIFGDCIYFMLCFTIFTGIRVYPIFGYYLKYLDFGFWIFLSTFRVFQYYIYKPFNDYLKNKNSN
jgi:hypothetical protein